MKIKSFQDACKVLKLDPSVLPIVDHLPEQDRDPIIARYEMEIITRGLNYDEKLKKEWEPDWGDYDENKYWPWFDMGGKDNAGFAFASSYYDCDDSGTIVGSRLCFRTRALSDYAGQQFGDIYKRFMVIPRRK